MNIRAKLDNAVFHALLIVFLVATTALGSRYAFSVDITRSARNSLSEHSKAVLTKAQQPITIEVYAGRGSLLVQAGKDLAERFQRQSSLITFSHVDLNKDPSITRDLGVQKNGEVIVKLGQKRQRSQALTEAAITGAIESLMLTETRRAVFVTGHGERQPSGSANHDYGEFGHRLSERGYTLVEHNLRLDTLVPRDGDVLVLASPERALHPDDLGALRGHLDGGGKVLWMLDTHTPALAALETLTGLRALPGVIVDAATDSLKLPRPDFAVVSDYANHKLTRGMDGISLFPRAIAFTDDALLDGWTANALLSSTPRSWNETGDISGRIAPDQQQEQAGPLTFGWSLTHRDFKGELTVIGDGDFLANSWLGNGVNLALGERMFDVLASAEPVLTDAMPARDRFVSVSANQSALLGSMLFGVVPLLLATAAFFSWRRQSQ